jgi:hypothetical protein
MKLLDIPLGLIINFHESSRASACSGPVVELGIRNRRKRRMGPSIYEPRETGAEKSLNLEL